MAWTATEMIPECFVCCLWPFAHSLHVFLSHRESLWRSFVSVMAFTVNVAVMGYTNGIIKSPGSAIRPAFGLLLQSGLIVTLVWTWLGTFTGKLLFCPLK